jgi:DNA-binding SARP family transcriptional activator
MLRVRVLGELSLERDGRRLEPPASRRARELLAWLALHPGPHARGELAGRFWPDVLDESARTSLRNALWAVRRALEGGAGALVATRERVELAGEPAVWVDARELARLAREGRHDEALSLCRGDLLDGLDSDWVHEAREQQRAEVGRICAELVAHAEADGDLARAVELTRRRVALDPLSEESQRELIRLLAANGDRAAALAAYARLRERLRAELGIAPSPATRRLVDDLRVERAPPLPAARRRGDAGPAPRAARRPGQLPFVGREREREQLRAAWARAVEHASPELVVLAGEPGIGKTRLARELADELRAGGATVLSGSCREEALVPYQPFVEALGAHVADWDDAALDRHARGRASELALLLPEVAARGGRERARGAPEARRYVMFEAVAALLAAIAAEAPVLLLIDDLQWADEATVLLLAHVLRAAAPARLLVVGAQRDAAVQRPALVEALAELGRDVPVERVRLEGLTADDLARLVEHAALRADAAGFGRALHAGTGGNPFFAGELLRHLEETALDVAALPAERALALAGVPEAVRDVLAARLARLGETTARLLTIAAVAGAEFRLELVERVSALDSDALLEALDEAIAAGLVVESPGAAGSCRFRHALVREAVYESVSRARRRHLHRRVAEGLEEMAARGSSVPLAELAHHYCAAGAAGDPARAVDYALEAGEEAIARTAYEQAIAVLTEALALLAPDDRRRTRLNVRRMVAFQALSHAHLDRPAGVAPPVGG